MHSNRLVRISTAPNSLEDLIRDALRSAKIAETKGDRLQRDEYLWLVGELEALRRAKQPQ